MSELPKLKFIPGDCICKILNNRLITRYIANYNPDNSGSEPDEPHYYLGSFPDGGYDIVLKAEHVEKIYKFKEELKEEFPEYFL